MEEIWICPICNKTFIFKKRTALRQKTAHFEKCKNIQKFEQLFNISFNKENIEKILIEKYGSANELNHICKENNIHLNFHRICSEFGINLNQKIFTNNKNIKERRKKTNIEKYGTSHNFNKNSESRKKWENRLLKEEGITNVFQRKDVKDKIKKTIIDHFGEDGLKYINSKEYQIKKWIKDGLSEDEANEKYKQICRLKGNSMRLSYFKEKYGDEEGYRIFLERLNKINLSLLNNSNKTISSLNIKFKNMLDSLGIKYIQEFELEYDNKNNEPKFLYYDFLIDNWIFELNGDYWHASPKIYKESDLIKYPGNLLLTASQVWEKDKFKKDLAELNGYNVIYIWESDINDKEKWNQIENIFKRYANSKN